MKRVLALAALLVVTGCAPSEDRDDRDDPGSAPSASEPSASEPGPDESGPSGSSSSTPPADAAPTPTLAVLPWEDTGRPVTEEVTAGGGWTAVVDEERSLVTLSGTTNVTVSGDKRFRVDTVLLDEGWAVVVLRDTLQQRPSRASVIDLTNGRTTVLDGASDPPTVNGGTWALRGGLLAHATRQAGAYCLAVRDLAAGPAAQGHVGYCAPDRHGFSNARTSPAGLGLMTFDDARPSCRSLGTLTGSEVLPVPGVQPCAGWELVPTGAGPVWSEIPDENVVDEALVFAASGESAVELGAATSGSLTWCAGATYFVRDPHQRGDPAQLMRWTDAGVFEIVYETPPGGQAFLDGPRCGGDRITVSALAESGDEQVSAPVP